MTPCPDGWRELVDGGVVTCDPWPEDGPYECAEDEAHFPGEPGCTRIGTDCPAGSWADDLPEEGTIMYVLADAPAGGAGTRESPFGSIDEALDVADEGTIIALSKGAFDEAVILQNGITLWGACVTETVVTCSTHSTNTATVTVDGRNTGVRNIQISGQRPGVTVAGGSSCSALFEGVLIARALHVGVFVAEGTMTARDLVVRETRSRTSDREFGDGLVVRYGAEVAVNRAVFEWNSHAGVHANDPATTLSLIDVAIRETQSSGRSRESGEGLIVEGGAEVEVVRAVFDRNHEVGVLAYGGGTTLSLRDVVVRETLSQEGERTFGRGLEAQRAAEVEVSRAVFEGNRCPFGTHA